MHLLTFIMRSSLEPKVATASIIAILATKHNDECHKTTEIMLNICLQ